MKTKILIAVHQIFGLFLLGDCKKRGTAQENKLLITDLHSPIKLMLSS